MDAARRDPAAGPTAARRIDLNADIGEGPGPDGLDHDAELIGLVSSVNIACGGHAGDRGSMSRTVALAVAAGVAIGAHPSFPDRDGFGRRAVTMPDEALEASIVEQVGALAAIAEAAGAPLRHVKPHGALYSLAAADAAVAAVVARAVRRCGADLILVGLAGSVGLATAEAAGLRVAAEAFPDRAYEPDGTLRSRLRPDAVLLDSTLVGRRARAMAVEGLVEAIDGSRLTISADTLCLHGDTPGVVAHARAVRAALDDAGVRIAALPGSATSGSAPAVRAFGDAAVLVELAGPVGPATSRRVHELAASIEAGTLAVGRAGWGRPVPGATSVLVPIDPLVPGVAAAVRHLRRLVEAWPEGTSGAGSTPPAQTIAVGVLYGGVDGPDLDDVAESAGLTPDGIVELHAASVYEVLFLGFAPGFAYLGPLDERLVLPRLDVPRVTVPAGSVGIAGPHTAVYPVPSPGGWRIIGRTASVLWDPRRARPNLLAPGDRVRFVPQR
jgi:UPF0271 protein